jgi:MerR family transcriptional regulator, copper efflux regulator
VRFIRQAQALGLSLPEIRELVAFNGQGGQARCRRVRQILTYRLSELQDRLRALQALRRSLKDALAECERTLSASEDAACPVATNLGRRAHPDSARRHPASRHSVTS